MNAVIITTRYPEKRVSGSRWTPVIDPPPFLPPFRFVRWPKGSPRDSCHEGHVAGRMKREAEEQSHRFKLKSGNTREEETFAGLSGLITPGAPSLSEITDDASILPSRFSFSFRSDRRDDSQNPGPTSAQVLLAGEWHLCYFSPLSFLCFEEYNVWRGFRIPESLRGAVDEGFRAPGVVCLIVLGVCRFLDFYELVWPSRGWFLALRCSCKQRSFLKSCNLAIRV